MNTNSLRLFDFFLRLPPVQRLLLAAVLVIAVALIFFLFGRAFGRLEAQNKLHVQLKSGRQDAIKRSRAVLGGQMVEQIAPFLPGFPCNPADVRFVGKPVDFLGFPGSAEGTAVSEILLIEVKTGKSVLSKREQEIKKAVEEGRVRYIEYRL
ncbi:MAG: Holliday junction resolvase [Treponema sp.]|jgi:predicted Holliday junction resolvase-like endonuclease|nr:Holliday junction resolvase [Treponema sp.]